MSQKTWAEDKMKRYTFFTYYDKDDSYRIDRTGGVIVLSKNTEEYLGVENLYTRLLRHRKSRISTNTEGRNAIFRTFLTHCLLETNADAAYEKLGYEVRDYLNIASGNDITVIVDLIKEEALNLRQVKSIER